MNQIIPLEKDAKVFFKANGQNERISPPYTTGGKSMFYTFVMKGKIAASGNIQYLLDETGSRADVPSYCYNSMFGRCSKFSECHMKVEMKGVYNTSTHGNTTKTVVYDL